MVWRCAWCCVARTDWQALAAVACRGLPLAMRLLFRTRPSVAWRCVATKPDDGMRDSHSLWRQGQWFWCSKCGGVSSRRLRLLGDPCQQRSAAGRDARTARLWAGFTPWGEKRRLDGTRPTPFLGTTLADAATAWADGLAELLKIQPVQLLDFFRRPEYGASAGDFPLAFVRGARLARRMFGPDDA